MLCVRDDVQPAAAEEPTSDPLAATFEIGERVQITALFNAPNLNGSVVIVHAYDSDSNRFTVKLARQTVNVKALNLLRPSWCQRVILAGGGYAGRLVPSADRTRDEAAEGGDFDDEGFNGGWVLPLAVCRTVFVNEGAPLCGFAVHPIGSSGP